ncbi:MAG TPA: DUF4231 domain-containing protein [Cyanothece sp. UBA12306]|nr:DUF4231 domain-containing protein [Cyanothece sp. UBA12306]
MAEEKSQKSLSYHEQLEEEIIGLINKTSLSDLQKQFMKARWLDQVLWLEGRAEKFKNRYYKLRMITIIGGVIVPALVTFQSDNPTIKNAITWTTWGLSQAVAISAAVEEFFHYGERHRHYRNTAETMKIEGWQFLQLSGSYRNAKSYSDVYSDFAQRVETIIQRDVDGYFSEVVADKKPDDIEPKNQEDNPPSS